MSTRTTNSQYHSGDRISERAARRAVAHYGGTVSKRAPAPAVDPANVIDNDRRDTHGSAGDVRVLRRWSVADLIAAATWGRAFA